MKGIIYKITNKVTGESYIGQTRYTMEFRWRQHQNAKDKSYFHNSIRKYGVKNFTAEILEECDTAADLSSREIYYIAKYDTIANGYNRSVGGEQNPLKITSDTQIEEICGLYLSGFSSTKIASLYNVDKATILKTLHAMGIKLRSRKLDINRQEFNELVTDYKSGYSLKQLAKRYGCSGSGLKGYLEKRGVEIRDKYNILKNEEEQQELIDEYLGDTYSLREIQQRHHCSYAIFCRILSMHGISRGKKHFKMTDKECLEAIGMHNEGKSVREIAKRFKVDKCTIYSMFRRYHVGYLTV